MLKRLLAFSILYICTIAVFSQTILISPTGDGGFENGATFAANGWTEVNGATNQFFVGSVAVPSAGSNSAYISDNVTGATYNYVNTAPSTVFFYRDISFPAGQPNIVLSFKWKTQGEGSYDYVSVFSMPTSNTPMVNMPVGGFQSWLNIPTTYPGAVIHCSPPNLNLQSTYQTQTICLPSSYAGTTRRVVFMWSNDGSAGSQPPGSIDEISLVSSLPPTAPANSPTALVLTPFSITQINGSFTAAAGSPDAYLVVRYPAGSTPTNPVNGTSYTTGSALGLGTVVQSSAATTFSATGLSPSTSYDFYIYSYNTAPCASGPLYKTTAPLFGTATTLTCPSLAAGTYSVGPTGTYLSLTAAAAALANGTTGPVIFQLQTTYLSSVETFPITFSGTPCPLIGGVIIRPIAGATALSITSSNTTGTINFDGGDNITIDGRAGGVGPSQLTISNTSTTGYTIQFINNATFNTIKFSTITGANAGTTSGVILFNTSVGFTAGNSNNTIDNCDIKDDISTPTNLIYCNGTVTNYATQNNNITVSNSLLHDWFNASSTTASAAINVVAGASDWSITNNSFYQTVARTFTMTTATDQGAIFIASATFGFNFNISNNFIGGSAPLAGGAPLTWIGTGTTGSPTVRMIRFSAGPGGVFSNISNNTIANIAVTTASTSTSNGMLQHLNGNVNINNNTIGSQSATGNITFTISSTTVAPFFYGIAYGLGAPISIINVTNNTIGGLTVTTTSTGSASFRILYGQPVALSKILLNNNTIGGSVANSIQQLTNNITTAIMILNPTIDDIVTNNTIRNITHNNTGVSGSLTGINVQASGGRHTITGNTIFNLTTNSTNVAINNAASVVGLTMTGSVVGGTNVSNNTIYGLSNTNATVAGWINGMYFGTSVAPQANTTIAKNNVHSINLLSPTAGMAGIFLPNAGNALVYNNMVRLGIDDAGVSITNSLQINGIYKVATGSMSIYHNTVYIGGTGVTGAVNTFAFRRTSSGLADTIMNNIFYNARSNGSGTGIHYAVSQASAATPLVENYNDLYVDGTGGIIGQLVATDYATLPLWRAATNLDWNSVSGDPKLINPNGNAATVNLHIQAASVTPIEQAGYLLPLVALDFDLQTRAALTPVDIGADAGNFLLLDQSPPVIYYSQLISSCSTGDRTISGVNITDGTGIPLSGTLRPRIYYKKNAGSYFSQPGTFVSGSATNSNWNFTIVAADMGGLVATDVVSYFIVAQDIVATPNVGSNPAGVIATDVNTITTPPINPNTYSILGTSLSGTYTVGAAGNYATLTAAVAAYNTACLAGPVIFSLIDPTYPSETYPITVNANPFASSINTLTIKPAIGNSPSISGLSATALIVLNGADWVTIDGSNGSVPNSICPLSTASRNLTMTNTSTSTASAVIWLQTVAVGLNGATNNTIKNINLVGNLNTQTLFGVGSGSSTISTTSLGTGNNNNSFINNNISKTQYGIYSQGANLSNKNTGTIINQNLMNTLTPDNIRIGGILLGFEDNLQVSGNNISGLGGNSQDIYAIALGLTALSTTAFTGNEVTNATVANNQIGLVVNTTTFSAAGITVANCQNGTNTIANNMISGVFANGTSGDFASGIFIGGGPGSLTRIYYNSVSMSRSDITTGAAPTYAVAIGGVTPNIDMRDNILVSTGNNGTGVNVAIGLAYTSTVGNYFNLISDYNVLYVSGTGSAIGVTGSLASASGVPTAPGTYRTTLANWRTETGRDLNSLNILPTFVSSTDLHLVAATNQCLDGFGTPILGLTSDIDCQLRNSESPDIGADEYTSTPVLFTLAETSGIAPNDGIICTGSSVTLSVSSGNTFLWSNGATTSSIVVSPTSTTTYGVTVTLVGGCTRTFSQVITVNALPGLSETHIEPTTCLAANGSIDLTVTGTGTFTYNWFTPNGSGIVNGQQDQFNLTVGSYFVTVTSVSTGCTSTLTINLVGPGGCNICPTVGPTSTSPSGQVCANANFTITVTGLVNMGVTYGIQFVRSTVALPNPYVGGTVMATVPNGSLSGGGTSASAVVSIPTAGSYFLYSIISPTPADPLCRPFTGTTITVNPIPNAVATPASQFICSGSSITPIVLSGSVAGTVFNWTRDNTATVTGIAASGSGNISGTLTNTTAAPITVTFTITPTANGCTGPSTTATVVVNPIPTVNTIPNQSVCHNSPTTAVNFTGTVSGTVFNWTNNTPSIGLAASGSGNIPSFLAQNTTNATIVATITVTPSYTNGTTCTGTAKTFTITVTPAPKAVCKDAKIFLNAAGVATLLPSDIDGGSTGGNLSVSKSSFNCSNVGANSVTLTVTDACAKTSTCVATVTVVDAIPPVLVGVPANISIQCDQVLPAEPNVTATDNCSAVVTYTQTSLQSPWTQLCEHFSYDVVRTWTATDPSGNKTTKSQIISVKDTKAPTFKSVPPPFITVECDDDNDNNVDPVPVDACDGNPTMLLDIKYKFNPNGCPNSYVATYTWTAGDKCGNTTQYTQKITVEDKTPPAIFCPPNITMTSNVPVAVSWVKAKANDNCDGVTDVVQTTGPPSGSTFQPNTKTIITYTSTDQCGNISTCTFLVTIEKSSGKDGFTVGGEVKDLKGKAINSDVQISGSLNQFADVHTGNFGFSSIPKGADFEIKAHQNTNPLNGVNTLDLAYITDQVAGVNALNSPYKFLAADVDHSKEISINDISEIRKLILHVTDKFKNADSWEFISSPSVFTDPVNPWKDQIISAYPVKNLQADQNISFTGYKMGDVTEDANPVGLNSSLISKNTPAYTLYAENKSFRKGENLEVVISANDLANMKGLQFTLNYDVKDLEFVAVKGEQTGINAENFGLRFLDGGKITGSITLNNDENSDKLFTLLFKAKEDGQLNSSLSIGSQITPAEAYNKLDETLNLNLNFTENGIQADLSKVILYQNEPNPFENNTVIRFVMPIAQEATFSIFNVDGKLMKEFNQLYNKGENKVTIDRSELPASGVYYYQLKTTDFTGTKKMIFIH